MLPLLLALMGCAGREPVGYGQPRVFARSGPNLALAPEASENALAISYALRSTWPSVDVGYDFNLIESYTQAIYDDQSFYEFPGRGGDQTGVIGGYTQQSQSVRSGVRVRN